MNVIHWNDFLQRKETITDNVSLTTGVFDGVHAGHEKLIAKLLSFPDTRSILSTFTSNPFQFFYPERYLGDILTLDQKIERLSATGLDYLLLIDFSADFSKLTGRLFFHMLTERVSLQHVVLGRNHRCGHRGDTGPEEVRALLQPKGILVDIVEPLIVSGHPVSSTRIRETICSGHIERAAELLGTRFSLDTRGLQAVEKNGCISYVRSSIGQILPKEGLYACMADDGKSAVNAVVEIRNTELILTLKKQHEVSRIEFLHTIESEG